MKHPSPGPYMESFNPVFRVLDVMTGKSSLFTGQYNMKVIGGSAEGPGSIEYFNGEQLQQFNLQNGLGPTIWKPEDSNGHSNGSVPIFQHDCSGIVWRCEQGSPCASVPMHFPWPPEYYFVIEVTNRQVDLYSTYCEFSTEFTIKVHGLELSKYDLMAIVGWSLVFSLVFITIFVTCHQHKSGDTKTHRQKRKTSRVVPMPTITEVDISDDSETEEVINIVEGQGFEALPSEDTINRSRISTR
ncbi:cation channel sperm-associated protein subunit gamma 2-like isoform X2 [Patiria miniata]|uniref:CATSPERG C-terminal domain-containing protein n=1 Tax=Patiria miniata TaxID=46514 RepID=A0A914BHY9_PATMI|nr:cation channel sperm-associated protein subunit gamma 2-like isoform X2 [Patiria miniata]